MTEFFGFDVPPMPNSITGCGCPGAWVRLLERLDTTTGKWTLTAICGSCGDACVARGAVEMTPELRASLAQQVAESEQDAEDDREERAGEEWKE